MDVNLTDKEFYTIALYLKRLSWSDYQSNATDNDECYVMRDALYKLQKIINENGYDPR